jgi:hypothetical protein
VAGVGGVSIVVLLWIYYPTAIRVFAQPPPHSDEVVVIRLRSYHSQVSNSEHLLR